MAAQTDQLKVYVMAMMSIGAKVLQEIEVNDKPTTKKQLSSAQKKAEMMEFAIMRGAKRKNKSLTK